VDGFILGPVRRIFRPPVPEFDAKTCPRITLIDANQRSRHFAFIFYSRDSRAKRLGFCRGPAPGHPWLSAQILFQKQIHAIEIDDGMTDVQRVHPQDPTDSGAALAQGETR